MGREIADNTHRSPGENCDHSQWSNAAQNAYDRDSYVRTGASISISAGFPGGVFYGSNWNNYPPNGGWDCYPPIQQPYPVWNQPYQVWNQPQAPIILPPQVLPPQTWGPEILPPVVVPPQIIQPGAYPYNWNNSWNTPGSWNNGYQNWNNGNYWNNGWYNGWNNGWNNGYQNGYQNYPYQPGIAIQLWNQNYNQWPAWQQAQNPWQYQYQQYQPYQQYSQYQQYMPPRRRY